VVSDNKRFLGIGWQFPVKPASDGSIATSEYEENIRESIQIILETAKGERVMRPDFGCGIHDFVFETINASTLGQMESAILEALEKWEPRIESVNVDVKTNSPNGKLLIQINYRVRQTNNQFNIVYPFYITEGLGR